MEDHRLKAFCLVVEMESFSKAAKAKFMTQSAMSHLIKNLEDELGVRLLIRQGKKVIPTSAGKIFYANALKILGQYKTLDHDMNMLLHRVRGPLHIGATSTAAGYLLPQVLYSFTKSYPDVQVSVSVSNTEMIIHELQHAKIEMGIIEGKVKNSAIWMTEIAEDEIIIIASDDNPFNGKNQILPQELFSQPFIMPEPGSGIRECIEDFFSGAEIDPNAILTSMTLGSTELIVQMVKSGQGISFVSKWSVFNALKEGTISILNVRGKRLFRKFYLVTIDREPVSMVSRTFFDFLKEYRFFKPI
jgi:LysR family transcriptional regulator, transcriptional activator of the cysJI operon